MHTFIILFWRSSCKIYIAYVKCVTNFIINYNYVTNSFSIHVKKVVISHTGVHAVIQRHSYFAHSENLLLTMLFDERFHIPELGLRRILKSRKLIEK